MIGIRRIKNLVSTRLENGCNQSEMHDLKYDFIKAQTSDFFTSKKFIKNENDCLLRTNLKRELINRGILENQIREFIISRDDDSTFKIGMPNCQWDLHAYSSRYNDRTIHGTYLCQFSSLTGIDITEYEASDIAQFIIEADAQITKWSNDDWNELIRECQKNIKVKQMTELGIETIVSQKLKGTQIAFAIEKQKTQARLIFRIGKNQQMSFVLSHKNFIEQIDKIISFVVSTNTMLNELDLTCKIQSPDKWITWIEPDNE